LLFPVFRLGSRKIQESIQAQDGIKPPDEK
jgi:hypothetical protein